MQQVYVTLRYQVEGRSKMIDLALPTEIPVSLLVHGIVSGLALVSANKMKYAISEIKGKESYRIDDANTLADAGIMCGDILSLTIEGVVTPEGDTSATSQPRAYIQFTNGEIFKLNMYGETRIGRWSPNNDVDIDLTRFDAKKLVSRLHAHIERHADGIYYLIDDHSTNGTYLNEKRLAADTPYALRSGDKIAFGTLKSGIHITFVIK